MGEIGYNRREYLYDLTYCDILCIERGYYRRNREMWSATRWQAFQIMRAQVGDDSLKKSGIHKPTDLLQFPWEKEQSEPSSMPTEADIAEMQAMMREMNAQNEQSGT